MNNKKTIKKILIVLGIAIALLIAYAFINTKKSTNKNNSLSSLLNNSTLGQIKETDTKLANAEILKILGNIKNIKLNDDIFTNPIFKELKDSHFTIPKPLVIGRQNPFLPIGFEIIASQKEINLDQNIETQSETINGSAQDFFDKNKNSDSGVINF